MIQSEPSMITSRKNIPFTIYGILIIGAEINGAKLTLEVDTGATLSS